MKSVETDVIQLNGMNERREEIKRKRFVAMPIR